MIFINTIRLSYILQPKCIGSILHGTSRLSCSSIRKSSSSPTNTEADDLEEVYYGTLTKQIRRVKAFSLMTSLAGIISQPVLYKQVTALSQSMPLTIFAGSFVAFFTFGTPLLLHTITRKYVTHIYYNKKDVSYVAILWTIFLQKKKIEFRPEDIEVVDVPGMFTSFHIKGTPVFVDAKMFHDVNHYIKMMGYDKPIDFRLEDDLDENSKKTN